MKRDIRHVGVNVITSFQREEVEYPEFEFAPLADGSMPLPQPLLSASPVCMISLLSHRLDQADASRGVRDVLGRLFHHFRAAHLIKLQRRVASNTCAHEQARSGEGGVVGTENERLYQSLRFFACTGRSQRLQDVA